VVAPEASAAGLAALAQAFRRRVDRAGTVRHELTLFDPQARVRAALEPLLGRHLIETDVPVLDLTPNPEVVWERYDQRLRRSVRRAGQVGVVARRGRDGFETFYRLYAAQAREWPLPWHHRRDRLLRMIDALAERAEIWVGSYEGDPLCAQLVLVHSDREIHFWLSGARPESRKVAAFHFLLHEIILDASQRGIRACHFGTSLGNPGVERFKLAYGAVPRPLVRYFHQPRWVGWIQGMRW
jgi:lipid II:glycine glycyltransferase (peptidoglycan interpeptide bridge formation enzyme)